MNSQLNQNARPNGVARDKIASLQGRYPVGAAQYAKKTNFSAPQREPILRSELGDVLRSVRTSQGRTLREVSADAQVSLGYLSEVERGQKEASSELLDAICQALGVPLWLVLREVSTRLMVLDQAVVPDTVPDDFLAALTLK